MQHTHTHTYTHTHTRTHTHTYRSGCWTLTFADPPFQKCWVWKARTFTRATWVGHQCMWRTTWRSCLSVCAGAQELFAEGTHQSNLDWSPVYVEVTSVCRGQPAGHVYQYVLMHRRFAESQTTHGVWLLERRTFCQKRIDIMFCATHWRNFCRDYQSGMLHVAMLWRIVRL